MGLRSLNDGMNCHCERSEAIQFLGRGMGVLTGLPRKSDDFLAMTDNRNITKPMRNDGATKRFFGLRPLNDGSGLQEILRLKALNDGMNCHDAFCHPEFISGSIQGRSLQFNTFKMLLEFLPRSQSFGKGTPFQKPQSVRYPALMPYRNSLKQVQHDDSGL